MKSTRWILIGALVAATVSGTTASGHGFNKSARLADGAVRIRRTSRVFGIA